MALFKLKVGSYATGSGQNTRFYRAKDPKANIIESDIDLTKVDRRKFERYEGPPRSEEAVPAPSWHAQQWTPQRQDPTALGPTAAAEPGEDLESMTVVELRSLAAEEEISLHGATTKAEIINAIKGAHK